MLPFVLTGLLLPGLILANTQCPSGDISCPEGKTCCSVEGKASCCDEDSEGQLPLRATLPYSNSSNVVIRNSTWVYPDSGCTMFNCEGTCCSSAYGDCCPYRMANCCSGNICCEFGKTCCGTGCCPKLSSVCCSGLHCCSSGLTCCGDGCCPSMHRCCGTWCCKNSERCGLSYKTCHNAATKLAPASAMVAVVVLWLAVRMVSRI